MAVPLGFSELLRVQLEQGIEIIFREPISKKSRYNQTYLLWIKLIMMNFSLKPISEKYFICIVIGLVTTNIIWYTVIPPYLGFDISPVIITQSELITKLIMSHFFAIIGIFYIFPWVNFPSSVESIESGHILYVFLTLSIISISLIIKLSKGIRTTKRIIYAYVIHIEIMILFPWWLSANFGFS